MNAKIGALIGRSLGPVQEIDVEKEGSAWGKVLRLLIEIDIITPLAQGKTLNLKGMKTRISIT